MRHRLAAELRQQVAGAQARAEEHAVAGRVQGGQCRQSQQQRISAQAHHTPAPRRGGPDTGADGEQHQGHHGAGLAHRQRRSERGQGQGASPPRAAADRSSRGGRCADFQPQGQQQQGRGENDRAAADIGHRLGGGRVQRKDHGAERRGVFRPAACAAPVLHGQAQQAPQQEHVERVQREVGGMEAACLAIAAQPVQRIAQLQQGADAGQGLPPGLQAVHGRVVDDGVEVVELEAGREGVCVGQQRRCHQGRAQAGLFDPVSVHACPAAARRRPGRSDPRCPTSDRAHAAARPAPARRRARPRPPGSGRRLAWYRS